MVVGPCGAEAQYVKRLVGCGYFGPLLNGGSSVYEVICARGVPALHDRIFQLKAEEAHIIPETAVPPRAPAS